MHGTSPARQRLTPRKPEHPSPRTSEGVAQPTPAAAPSPGAALQHPGSDAMSGRRVLALAAAVTTVWALLAAAAWGVGPLFLVRPPITRRGAGFHEFKGTDCTHALAQGAWTDAFQSVSCTNDTRSEFATCGDTPQRHWRFAGEAQRCGARRLAAADARQLLAGQRLVFAGDSIARNLYGAALRLLGQPGQDIVVGHADFQHELEGGISLQFFWAPYPQNLTAVLGQLAAEGARNGEQQQQPHQQQQQQRRAAEAAAAAAGEEAADAAAEAQLQAEVDKELGQQVQERQGGAVVGGREQAAGSAEQQQLAAEQQAEEQQQHEEGAIGPRRRRRLLATEQQQQPEQQEQQAEQQRRRRPPSLAVLSTTLWHLLHFTEAADFQAQLGQLRAAVEGLAPAATGQGGGGSGTAGPRLVLASGTETFPNKMKTAEKQRTMTAANLDAYNRAIEQSGLLAPSGPFSLLDLFPLTRSCGEECSTDGVHSLPVVYDAALQLLLNIGAAEGQAAAQQQTRRALRRALLREWWPA
ncbi:hypothetical protein ABPG75_002865 [Micractinium tetrahymenae]